MLEVQPRVAQPLVLLHLREPPLGRREAVFERADHYVRTGELGSRLGRPASELLLVEADHLPRYLGANGGLVVGRLGRFGYMLAHLRFESSLQVDGPQQGRGGWSLMCG